ncbi:MAG: hypothetical protein ACYST2_00625 [Planctomycetota bacterium]|jgi:hypothetical protein
MNYFLIQAIVIAGMDDEGSAFWSQILILVVLGSFWGVYNLVRKKRNEFRDHEEETMARKVKIRNEFRPVRKLTGLYKNIANKYTKKEFDGVHVRSFFNNPAASRKIKAKSESIANKKRELQRGMEILELDFLLSMVENIEGNDQNDMIMRKLCFDELFRRVRLDHVNSQVLKVYAVNDENMYGKDIQCEALQELADRTAHHVHRQPVLSISK